MHKYTERIHNDPPTPPPPPPRGIIAEQTPSRVSASPLKAVGYVAAIMLGIIIGIPVGAALDRITAPRNDNYQIASLEDINSSSLTEPSDDVLNSYMPEEKVDDQRQTESPEDIPLNTDAQQPDDSEAVEPSNTDVEQPDDSEAVEQSNTDVEQPDDSEADEQSNTDVEQPDDSKTPKLSLNDKEKIYNDERWCGTSRDCYFIYVAPKKSSYKPDCSRLNMQLQKDNIKIVDLKLIQLFKKPTTKFRFQPYQEDKSKYFVEYNSLSTGIVIQLLDGGERIEVIGDGPMFRDLSQQYALLAKFSDKSTSDVEQPSKIISFFYEESEEQSKNLYKKIKFLNMNNGSMVVEGLRKGILILDIPFDENMRKYKYMDIRAFGYGETMTVHLPNPTKEDKYKSEIRLYKITPSKTSADPKTPSSINVEINYVYIGRVGYRIKPETVRLKYLMFDKIQKSANNDWLQIKVSVAKDTGENYNLGELKDDKKAKEFDGLLNTIKQITLDLPLYIDFYIQLDKVGNQSAVKPQDGTGMPFLWKRVKFPPPKD